MNRKEVTYLVVLLVIVSLWIYYLDVDLATVGCQDAVDAVDPGQGPRNSTLGFQKIYYIDFPE